MQRYARLVWLQLRTSLLVLVQYRADFVLDALFAMFWTFIAIVPLVVVFEQRRVIAGWQFGEALVVSGFFTMLSGVLEGAINPSLTTVIDHIRKGTLDFVLLKPADAQFLVSTAKFLPWRVVNVIAGIGVMVYAFVSLGRAPSFVHVVSATALFAVAVMLLYALWILIVSAGFYVVKIDNLSYLFTAIFDAARWPVSVFRGVMRFVFTFVIPLALMTTFPAEALLGRLSTETLLASFAGAAAFSLIARIVWLASLRRYTSASS